MIISGDLELKATMLGDISTSREVGPQDEMRGNFRQQVIDAVNCVNVENKITDATAFIVTRDEANQIDVTRVELLRTTAAKPDERSVMTDHLRYGFEEEQGWKFYRNMCELTEVLFNSEDQDEQSNSFCVGDINNNYFIEKG